MKVLEEYTKDTGNSKRTFFNHRKWLLDQGWIEPLKDGAVRVISFKRLILLLKINAPKQRGAKFISDYHHFKPFIYAAVVTYVGRTKKYHGKRAGAKYKGSTSQKLYSIFNLPHDYLAKYLGVSKSTAQNYRQYAQHFFVFDQLVFRLLDNVSPQDVKSYRRNSGETTQNIVAKKGRVYEQLPSDICSAILIKRCRV